MYSYATYTGNGITTDYAVPFPYLDQTHIEVSVGGVSVGFTWPSAGVVRCTAVPASGAVIVVRRNSSRALRLVDFADSSVITEQDLDRAHNQLQYLVQESFDQGATESFFSTDAQGARVINMADPLASTDGATKGYVDTTIADTVASLDLGGGGGGGEGDAIDLRPLNNTWTGVNNFNNLVGIGSATFDPVATVTRELINLDKGLQINNATDLAAQPGYGHITQMRRTTGYPEGWGGQFTGFGLGSWVGSLYGAGVSAWRTKTSTGRTGAISVALVSTNDTDRVSTKYGLDVRFMNREEGTTQGGDALANMAQTGNGTGSNAYNANSWGVQISSQARSDGGITLTGWNRGIRFMENWGDYCRAQDYSAAVTYSPGDYVKYAGSIFLCVLTAVGITPIAGAYWADYGVSDIVGAVGIDFAGVGPTTAGRMLGAIRLRGDMPILWDSEGFVQTGYSASTGLWTLKHGFADRGIAPLHRFGIDITTGDIWQGGTKRALTTRSSVSAHRGYAAFVIGGSAWSQIVCSGIERDDRGEYNASTGRFTPNTPGDYMVVWQVQTELTTGMNQRIYAGVWLNGSSYRAGEAYTQGGTTTALCSCIVRLNGVGDYITTHALSTDPSLTAFTGEPSGTYLQISKVQ